MKALVGWSLWVAVAMPFMFMIGMVWGGMLSLFTRSGTHRHLLVINGGIAAAAILVAVPWGGVLGVLFYGLPIAAGWLFAAGTAWRNTQG